MSRIELETLLAEFANAPPASAFTVEGARRSWYAFTQDFRIPDDLALSADAAAETRLEWVKRRGSAPNRAVLFLHGGGYVCGSAQTHRAIACGLAQSLDAAVASLDYRLAPEHPYPAALEDALRGFDALVGRGFAPERIAVAGDSAGGGLVMTLLLELKRQGRALPAAGWCISAWFDLLPRDNRPASNRVRDPIVFPQVLNASSLIYLGGHSASDPLVCPINADLEGLPPLLLQVGSGELLLDDSFRMANAAAAADIDVTLQVWPEMVHAWHLFAQKLGEGREAIRVAAAWLDGKLAP